MIPVSTLETHFGWFRDGALKVGVVGAVACLLAVPMWPATFVQSYLAGLMFWTLIAMGCLALMLIHNLTGGVWGHVTRRMTEAGARTFPLLAVLFIPVLIGIPQLYEWASADAVKASVVLQRKAGYLNVPFFCLRAVLYFAYWSAVGWLMTEWSREADRTGDHAPMDAAERWSGPALAVFTVTATFAGIDWVMSLEPKWVSAVYGVIFGVTGLLAAHAFVVVILYRVLKIPGMERAVSADQLNDLGNFLLGFTMFWAYVTFAQFLIIWSGNIQEEVTYFVARSSHGWLYVAQAVALLRFVIPFLFLLSPTIKRDIVTLSRVARLALLAHMVDVFFLIQPVFRKQLYVHVVDLLPFLAVGGLWIWLFTRNLLARPMPAVPPGGGAAHG